MSEGGLTWRVVVATIIGAAVVALLAGCAGTAPSAGGGTGRPPGQSDGMMGGGMGGGMIDGGMMGGSAPYNPGDRPLTIGQAGESATRYIAGYGGDLELKEVMEFAQNFYAEVEERSTGVHAMELLIDKYTGRAYPEMGPNMMWNEKYGMMSGMMGSPRGRGASPVEMPVAPARAKELAQRFLDEKMPGLTVADPDRFYGYYTLHTVREGHVEGMLSVNGYNGQVWYHSWHGAFIGMEEANHNG